MYSYILYMTWRRVFPPWRLPAPTPSFSYFLAVKLTLYSLLIWMLFFFSLFILTNFLVHLIPFLCKSFCSQLFIVKSSKLYPSFLLDFEIAVFHHIHAVLMVKEQILKLNISRQHEEGHWNITTGPLKFSCSFLLLLACIEGHCRVSLPGEQCSDQLNSVRDTLAIT